MMSAFNLRSRGIFLVLVPFVFQIFFTVVLVVSLLHLQSELLRQSHSRRVITRAHILSCDLVQLLTKLTFEQKKPGKALLNQAETRANGAELTKSLKDLVKMTKSDPNQLRNVEALKATGISMVALFDEICEEQDKGVEHWKTVKKAYSNKVDLKLIQFLNQVSDLIDVEASKKDLKATLSQEFKSTIGALLLGAVIVSLVVASALGIVFSISIQKPLNRIAENSKLMSQRKTLLPALEGNDEFAELDRLLHEAALGIEQAFLSEQSMVDNAVDMICTLDCDGRFKRVNIAAQNLTGWPFEVLIRQSVFDLIVPEDLVHAEEEFSRAKSKTERCVFDLRLARRDGAIVDTRWACLYSPDEDVFAVVQNVTEEKNVERLKQDFLDMITHDLRSPLTSMLGSLTLVAEGAKGDVGDDVKQEVGAALSKVEHLIDFVNDLLDFQKLKAGRMQMQIDRCSLDDLIEESITLVYDFAQSSQVTFEFKRSNLSIDCDRGKLIQVLVNLMSNAVKFSPAPSTVEIAIEDKGKTITIHVIDQGPGVPEHLKTRIFEAFEQVQDHEKSKGGTGLGLAICKLVVEAHSGIIEVDSNERGSDFWFTLPKEQDS
jgi:PAS domain S-box-containing protein